MVKRLVKAVLAAGCAMLLGGAGPTLPALSDEDAARWTAIGRVNSAGYKRSQMCTGALVAPDVVLTAAHCAVRASGASTLPRDGKFVAGWIRGEYEGVGDVTEIAVHPEYLASGRPDIRYDIALLQLAEPMTPAVLASAAAEILPPALALIGYHRDRPNLLSGRTDCAASDGPGGMIRLTCPVKPGNSGGPVMVDGPGGWQIIGVVSASAPGGALAARLDGWVAQMLSAR